MTRITRTFKRRIAQVYDFDGKALNYVGDISYITDTDKISALTALGVNVETVHVVDVSVEDVKYGMDEDRFITNSVVIE